MECQILKQTFSEKNVRGQMQLSRHHHNYDGQILMMDD